MPIVYQQIMVRLRPELQIDIYLSKESKYKNRSELIQSIQ